MTTPLEPSGSSQPRTDGTALPHRSALWLRLGWVLAAGFFCLTAVLAWLQLQPSPKASPDNFAKVKQGMTLRQVEGILGPGKAGYSPFFDAEGSNKPSIPENAVWKQWSYDSGTSEIVFYVAFADDKVVGSTMTQQSPRRVVIEQLLLPREFLSEAGLKNQVFLYRGGFLDCWIECHKGGQKEVVGLISAQELRQEGKKILAQTKQWIAPDMEKDLHGYIVWEPFGQGENGPTLTVSCHFAGRTFSRVLTGLGKQGPWNPVAYISFGPDTEIILSMGQMAGDCSLRCKLPAESK
jgi:hypothetical protein